MTMYHPVLSKTVHVLDWSQLLSAIRISWLNSLTERPSGFWWMQWEQETQGHGTSHWLVSCDDSTRQYAVARKIASFSNHSSHYQCQRVVIACCLILLGLGSVTSHISARTSSVHNWKWLAALCHSPCFPRPCCWSGGKSEHSERW
jgi:hypothetical protein